MSGQVTVVVDILDELGRNLSLSLLPPPVGALNPAQVEFLNIAGKK